MRLRWGGHERCPSKSSLTINLYPLIKSRKEKLEFKSPVEHQLILGANSWALTMKLLPERLEWMFATLAIQYPFFCNNNQRLLWRTAFSF